MAKINERIIAAEKAPAQSEKEKDQEDRDHNDHQGGSGEVSLESSENNADTKDTPEATPNQGVLILDATCTPADVHFPTDLGLLNEAREKLDGIIDTLHKANGKGQRRPRTYREKARKDYLNVSKQRSPRKNQLRKAIKNQLQYTERNLRFVDRMLQEIENGAELLSKQQQMLLDTIHKLVDQQSTMFKSKTHRVEDRIISLHQPHVRPIVRGKAGAAVEFGAKVAISLEKGYSRIEKLSWDSFNEAGTLIESINSYKSRNDCYPEAILADRIYRNKDNLAFCKKYKIRLSGPKLGRPRANALMKKAEKQIERQDARERNARERNAVEGKFGKGKGKRKYGLARITAKLKETAESVIALQFLVMNLELKLRVLFAQIFYWTFWQEENVI